MSTRNRLLFKVVSRFIEKMKMSKFTDTTNLNDKKNCLSLQCGDPQIRDYPCNSSLPTICSALGKNKLPYILNNKYLQKYKIINDMMLSTSLYK